MNIANILKNWKTTLAGFISIAVTVATSMKWISPEAGTAIITLAVSLGLVVAKDGNVTGK